MDTIDQWLLKWDPTDFSFTVFVFIMLVAGLLFVWRCWWPWYSARANRAQAERLELDRKRTEAELLGQSRQTEIMTAIRDALVELKVLVGQQGRMLEQLSHPDSRSGSGSQ